MIGPMSPIRLQLHGAPTLFDAQGRACVLDRHAALLAARLAFDGPQARAELARWLWPWAEPARARANLRQRLLRMRTLAGADWVVGDEFLALDPAVQALDDASDAPLLHGIEPDADEPPAQWLAQARQRQRRQLLDALAATAASAEREQRWDAAIAAVQRQVAIDPLAEALQRELIRLHYLNHDSRRARAAYDALASMLEREFDAQPGAETEALMRLVLAGQRPPSSARLAATVLQRPPSWVGRQRERVAVERALAERRALLVLGEAGMGKSRLLAETLPDAAAVVGVKAQAGDAAVPYATLARLLRKLFEGVPARAAGPRALALEPLLPLLPERRAMPPAGLPTGGERLVLQSAVEQVLANASLLAVAVDDLHFADEASLESITALVGAAPLAGIAWIFTQRPGEGSAAAAALREQLEEARRLDLLGLSPLDRADMAELLVSLALPGLDADDSDALAKLADRLVRHTGGNPLFALETLKVMAIEGGAPGRLPQPATVGSLIDRRLRQLSPGALALARVAAIAGGDFSPALAESVLGRRAIELADAWTELEAAQVLRARDFAHDLVLEAVQRSVPRALTEHLHAAVAAHLESAVAAHLVSPQSAAGEPARIAAHWLAARREPEALPWLLRAADHARDTLRRREEAAFIERAMEITAALGAGAPGPTAHALGLRAYAARECVEGVQAALPLLDRALALAPGLRERAQVLAQRAAARSKEYELDGAIADGRAALADGLGLGDDELTAEIVTDLAAALSMAGRHAEAVDLLDRHWGAVEALPEPISAYYSQRAMVLDNAGRPHAARPFHQRAMAIAQQRGEHSETIICGQNMAVGDIDIGLLERAAAQLEDCERLRLAHDAMVGMNVVSWGLQAIVWRDLGHAGRALDASERTIAADREQRPARLPMDLLHRAWTWTHLGQWARALQDLLPDEAYAEVPAWVLARALQLRSRIASARGLPSAATLERAQGLLTASMLRTMRDSVALDAAAAAADRGTAEALRASAQADGFHGLRWTAEWTCARLAGAAGDAVAARAHAAACMERPAGEVPLDLQAGSWWHGLWRLWTLLGDPGAAQAARAEGLAWLHRCLRHDVAPAFQPSFRDAVRAHRELLAG